MTAFPTVGRLRREGAHTTCSDTGEAEAQCLLRAISAIKLPALAGADLQLFRTLMRDTWPGVDTPGEAQAELEQALRAVLEEWNFEAAEGQVCIMLIASSLCTLMSSCT